MSPEFVPNKQNLKHLENVGVLSNVSVRACVCLRACVKNSFTFVSVLFCFSFVFFSLMDTRSYISDKMPKLLFYQ